MKIKQILTSGSVIFFQKSMMEKYNLNPYKSIHEPALFMGCYNSKDINRIYRHKSLAVIFWTGADAMRYLQSPNIADSLRASHIKHIAQCEYIVRDLDRVGLKYKRLNISTSNYKRNPVPLGKSVYIYYGGNDAAFKNFYNYPLFIEISNELKNIQFISGYRGKFKPIEMPAVYEECFIGLRLTPHDGIPHTVIEMGMMGRKCVWNEPFPGCYQWKNKQDVKNAILKEHENIGKTNVELAKQVEKYLDIGTNWLKESFWND